MTNNMELSTEEEESLEKRYDNCLTIKERHPPLPADAFPTPTLESSDSSGMNNINLQLPQLPTPTTIRQQQQQQQQQYSPLSAPPEVIVSSWHELNEDDDKNTTTTTTSTSEDNPPDESNQDLVDDSGTNVVDNENKLINKKVLPVKAFKMLDISAGDYENDCQSGLRSPEKGSESQNRTKDRSASAWDKLLLHTIHRSRSAGTNMPDHRIFINKHQNDNASSQGGGGTSKFEAITEQNDSCSGGGGGDPPVSKGKKGFRNLALFALRQKRPSAPSAEFQVTPTSSTTSGNSPLVVPSTTTQSSLSPPRDSNSSSNNTMAFSKAKLQLFSASFDDLLNDPDGLKLFHKFLLSEYSDENIQFWIACNDYKKLSEPKDLCKHAQHIYDEFLSSQAPKEINLDSLTRLQTVSLLSTPTGSTFEQAEKKIHGLMHRDSYPRFLRSALFQEALLRVEDDSSSSTDATTSMSILSSTSSTLATTTTTTTNNNATGASTGLTTNASRSSLAQ